MKTLIRGVFWLLLLGGLLALLLWFGGAWLAAREITRPSRRALEEHHHVILNAPADHGIRIESFTLAEGTPVLFCRPAAEAHLDERGKKLRLQLASRGLPLPPPGMENGATLVLLHGRRGRKEDNLAVAVRFCAAGFRCLLPDLPGHGDHPELDASYGPGESDLPSAVLTQAAARFAFAPHPAALWGISMGGSVAVHAAAANPQQWDALVVVASFDALAPVIYRQCSQRLGGKLGPLFYSTVIRQMPDVALDDIRPAAAARRISAPALVAHGGDDPLIPAEAARRLYDALASTDKQWIDVGSGTHGNVLITPQPLYAEMTAWLLAKLGGAQ